MKCKMLDLKFNMDGDIASEEECGREVVGVTEDGVHVCKDCAKMMEAEGFRVDYIEEDPCTENSCP